MGFSGLHKNASEFYCKTPTMFKLTKNHLLRFTRRCNKKRQFHREKMCFGPKNVEKLGFLGVFMSALRASENSLFISNDIQMHKIVVYLDAQGVATIKQIIFSRKKKQVLGRKNVKERCFSGFSDIAQLITFVVLLH